MRRADSLEKTLMLKKIERRMRRGWQRMRWLGDITDSVDMSLSTLWKKVKDSEGQWSLVCCSPWDCKESDMTDWAHIEWQVLENSKRRSWWNFLLIYQILPKSDSIYKCQFNHNDIGFLTLKDFFLLIFYLIQFYFSHCY